jgi:leader peptidase (prepilin peptidase)/N-methyltransferase
MYSQYFLSNSGELGLRVAQFVITSLFCGLLVAVAFIALDTMHIPDSITYPGIPIAMILSVFMGHPHFFDGLIGGVAGYLIIRLIADGYRLLTGRMGMGYGDAKLLALIGGILGWQALFPTLFLASFQGTIIGISAILWFRKKNSKEPARTPPTSNYSVASSEDETKNSCADKQGEEQEEQNVPPSSLRYTRIPFGPFLSLGAIEVLFLRDILPCFFPYLQ